MINSLILISMFREDGYMDAWDILYQQRAPILSFKVSDMPLNAVKVIILSSLVLNVINPVLNS